MGFPTFGFFHSDNTTPMIARVVSISLVIVFLITWGKRGANEVRRRLNEDDHEPIFPHPESHTVELITICDEENNDQISEEFKAPCNIAILSKNEQGKVEELGDWHQLFPEGGNNGETETSGRGGSGFDSTKGAKEDASAGDGFDGTRKLRG